MQRDPNPAATWDKAPKHGSVRPSRAQPNRVRRPAGPAAPGGVPEQAEPHGGPAAASLHPESHRHLPEQPVPGSHRYPGILRSDLIGQPEVGGVFPGAEPGVPLHLWDLSSLQSPTGTSETLPSLSTSIEESPLLNEILHTLAQAKLSPRHDGQVRTGLCCWWEGLLVSSTSPHVPSSPHVLRTIRRVAGFWALSASLWFDGSIVWTGVKPDQNLLWFHRKFWMLWRQTVSDSLMRSVRRSGFIVLHSFWLVLLGRNGSAPVRRAVPVLQRIKDGFTEAVPP
ncbi:uncharacterized protein LOC129352744 [Poeciliopsis prolifica]|uniref:uncharacterized protein LOC129352744 n=1 Tax=Poeciliopsis prolifica TaxID=188132 RepID=UPI002413D253|nr:uncharacterized protein LOC129352744 [Poeciliopsis prolifica]